MFCKFQTYESMEGVTPTDFALNVREIKEIREQRVHWEEDGKKTVLSCSIIMARNEGVHEVPGTLDEVRAKIMQAIREG